MRSRYTAFSLGLGAYLYDTLAAGHPDREHPRELMIRELSRVRDTQRFLGLTLLHASADATQGEVLFFARVFAKGTNVSFAELSEFVRENGAWRYLSGVLVPVAALSDDVATLTRESFLELASTLSISEST